MKRSGSEYEGDHRHASKRWLEATRSEMNYTLQQQPVQRSIQSIHSQLARLCQENFVGLQGAGVPPISTSFLSSQMNDPVQLIPRQRSDYSSQIVPNNTVVGSSLSSNISSNSKNLSHMIFSPRSQQLLQNVVRRPEPEATATPSISLPNQHQDTLASIVAKMTAENLKRQQQLQQQQISRLQREIQQIQQSTTMSSMFPINSMATSNVVSLLQLQQMQQQPGRLQEYGLSNDSQILDRLLNTSLQQHQMTSVPVAPSVASLQTLNIFPEHLNTTSLPLVQVPTNNSIGKMKSKKSSLNDPKILSLPVLVVTPETDRMRLSEHQFLLRRNIEFFEADEMDATTHIRGRNKSIQCGQVGIRCIHCAHVPVSRRQKGSTYFPSAKLGIYQAAQNMLTTHIQSGLCNYIPDHVKTQFTCALINKASDSLNQNNGSGRPYWAQTATTLGLVDTESHGIRFVRNIPRDAQVVPDSGTISGTNSVR